MSSLIEFSKKSKRQRADRKETVTAQMQGKMVEHALISVHIY